MRTTSFVLAMSALIAGCASARHEGTGDDGPGDVDGASPIEADAGADAGSGDPIDAHDAGAPITDAGAPTTDAATSPDAGTTWYALALPDSPTATCLAPVGGAPIACPPPGTATAQDGSYHDTPVRWTLAGVPPGAALEVTTGLLWQRDLAPTAMTWEDAWTYCSHLSIGGLDGWRLPLVQELVAITDLGQAAPPYVDPAILPTPAGPALWTWQQWEAFMDLEAWTVDLSSMSAAHAPKAQLRAARCVHLPGPSFPPARYTHVGPDSVWHDAIFGLDWYIYGAGPTVNATLTSALALCEQGTWNGHADWRVPTLKEASTAGQYGLAGGAWMLAQWENWGTILTSTPRPGSGAFYRLDTWTGHVTTGGATRTLCVRGQSAPPS